MIVAVCVVAMTNASPVPEANAPASGNPVAVEDTEDLAVDDTHDLETSEVLLKIIEKKIHKLFKVRTAEFNDSFLLI